MVKITIIVEQEDGNKRSFIYEVDSLSKSDLSEIMNTISDNAEDRGLTVELLNEILD